MTSTRYERHPTFRRRARSTVALSALLLLAAAQTAPEDESPDVMTRAQLQQVAMAGSKLTEEQAEGLEAALEATPDDVRIRVRLAAYYMRRQFRSAESRQAHATHALWIIKNRPESPAAALFVTHIDRHLHRETYSVARDAWLKHVEENPGNVTILGNAAEFFTLGERAKAIELVTRARELEPESPEWPKRLGRLHALDVLRRGQIDAEAAKRSFKAYEAALGKTKGRERYYMLKDVARVALYAGELEKAKTYATELLDSAVEGVPDWNYGNAVHHGNLILGHAALIEGDLESAERYLIRAGKTPGSPQLNSFGPNMMLAEALLEAGRKETVIEYLKLCGKFWKRGQVDKWIEVIKEGGIPKFGANLCY